MTAATTAEIVALRRDLHAHPELALRREAHDRGHRRLADEIRDAATGPARWYRSAVRRGRRRRGADDRAARRHRRAAARGSQGRALPLGRSRAPATPAATTPTPRSCSGRPRNWRTTDLPGRVRLIFQPAEESVPGGALSVIDAGAMDGVERIFALHCDPRLATGQIGVRVGADHRSLRPDRGPADRPGRAHRPAAPDRRPGLRAGPADHRPARRAVAAGRPARGRVAGLGLGRGRPGERTPSPATGGCAGTLRVLDRDAWDAAEPMVRELVDQTRRPDRCACRDRVHRGASRRCVNDSRVRRRSSAVAVLRGARAGRRSPRPRRAWAARTSPGTSTRCPARWPASGCGAAAGPPFDLHQGTFDIDEDALDIGVRYTVALAHTRWRSTRPRG